LNAIETAPPIEKTSSEEKSSGEVPGVASLASWESRLKNAIEQDATELAEPPIAAKASKAEPSRPSGPEFEFHIDPPLAEQSLKTEKLKTKKLKTEKLKTEKQPVAATRKETKKQPVVAAELTEAAAAEVAELTVGLNTLHTRRSRRFSPLKVAAMLIGPGLMGIFLGLYALLWIKGPSGDLVNLAQVLPSAMLPNSMLPSTMLPPAATAPEIESLDETPLPVIVQNLPVEEEPLEEIIKEPLRDPAVQVATAEEPLPQVLSTLPEQFSESLTAARAAEPDLIGGDLSTNQAVSQKGRAYMAFCQLAKDFEAIHLPELDALSQAEIASAQELFASLASNSLALGDLASIASRWWGYESRPNEGIFFAGQIQNTQSLGTQTLCYVALDEPATATIVPVLLSRPPSLDGDRIVVVGRIVAEPRRSLQDFSVDLPQVVVADYSQALQP